jgi:hypothetical protein
MRTSVRGEVGDKLAQAVWTHEVRPEGVTSEARNQRRRTAERQTGEAGLDARSAPQRGDERSEESTEAILTVREMRPAHPCPR